MLVPQEQPPDTGCAQGSDPKGRREREAVARPANRGTGGRSRIPWASPAPSSGSPRETRIRLAVVQQPEDKNENRAGDGQRNETHDPALQQPSTAHSAWLDGIDHAVQDSLASGTAKPAIGKYTL